MPPCQPYDFFFSFLCFQFLINVEPRRQTLTSTLVNIFHLTLIYDWFLRIPFIFWMNKNIWSRVGRPCTTHGWTIKLQNFFFLMNKSRPRTTHSLIINPQFFFFFFNEWEYFNKSRSRTAHAWTIKLQ